MKEIYQSSLVWSIVFSFLLILTFFINAEKLKNEQKVFQVKVLLDESCIKKNVKWVIASDEGCFITELKKTSKKLRCIKKELHVSVHDGFFYLNGKRFLKNNFIVNSTDGLLGLNGNFYKGSFFFILNEKGKVQLINLVDLEDYVFAVLRSESWPGWPLEVNKVFAVAFRSYVISKVKEAKKLKKTYHIKSTRQHQTYNGHSFMKRNSKILLQAVEETKGLFLAYENKPILAMFDSCCGGVIPSRIEGVAFEKAPYLARDYACEYCKVCKVYEWEVKYDFDQWTQLLRKKFPLLKKIKSIKVLSRDKAGLIKDIEVKDRKQTFLLKGKQLYSLLTDVKSFYFCIKKNESQIILKGRGYGHHLGLCQWGAREMVRKNIDYREILQFYYPNTTFVKLV